VKLGLLAHQPSNLLLLQLQASVRVMSRKLLLGLLPVVVN